MELQIIQNKIYEIRGMRVMLDFDLAGMYETETKRLKEAVRRNLNRFPSDFMFELDLKEWQILRTQIATSSWGGSRYSPFAFTEQGVAMLASILNSPKAIEIKNRNMRPTVLILTILLSINLIAQNNTPKNMALIPKGEFNMGKNTSNPTDWQPEHKVAIDSFYLDQYEVTNQQYAEFCRATKHTLPEFWGMKEFKCSADFPDYPIVGVSWFDADSYAKWAGKCLPTEAEWEYASRGGLVDKKFPNGDQIDSTKVNYSKKYKGTLKTGSFEPNNFGLYDMAGNVWEWTSDNYADDYYQVSEPNNPKGPKTGRFKVIRGGSWHSGAMCVQNYFRNGLSPSWVDFAVGFRCAKSLK